MSKFHINPNTQEVGKCQAQYNCRYKGQTEHYETADEAFEAAEKILENKYGNITSLSKSSSSQEYYVPEDHSFNSLKVSERRYQSPDQVFQPGDLMRYEGEIHKVEDIETNYNYDNLEDEYTVKTETGERIEFNEYQWNSSESFDIERLTNDYDDVEIPPGQYGAKLSDYINSGDTISYRGEEYVVEDFEYNRALLAYELNTNKGAIYIEDDEWYHNTSPNISVKKNN